MRTLTLDLETWIEETYGYTMYGFMKLPENMREEILEEGRRWLEEEDDCLDSDDVPGIVNGFCY